MRNAFATILLIIFGLIFVGVVLTVGNVLEERNSYRKSSVAVSPSPVSFNGYATPDDAAFRREQIKRCGDIPEDAKMYLGGLTRVNQVWSPDCKIIASSVFNLGMEGAGGNAEEGFLYTMLILRKK